MTAARHIDPASADAGSATIDDFSVQWRTFGGHDGYFGSEALLRDVLSPLVTLDAFAGATIAEIGCGNGRYIRTLARYARRVVGIEPGDGVENARRYCADAANVDVVRADVYALPPLPPLDWVLCIGVLHHLPEPLEALRRMRETLRPGGQALVWVYGREGNEAYLRVVEPLRRLTVRLPHAALHALSVVLAGALRAYVAACRVLALPMRAYARNVLAPLSFRALTLNVYDQLNPTIARYWRREEVEALMHAAGFHDVRLHHRHRYSWTAVGRA